MSMRWSIIGLVTTGVWMLSALSTIPANAQDQVGRRGAKVEQRDIPPPGDCASEGGCNWWKIRDAWTPSGSTQPVTVKLRFNLFHPAAEASDEVFTDQLAELNNHYEEYGIHFTAEVDAFTNSDYYTLDSEKELEAMKNTYANKPASQLNIYAVRQMDTKADREGKYRGARSYPWTSKASANQAGIVIDGDYVGGGHRLLTREIGRCLGLSHMFTGPNGGDKSRKARG